MFDTQRMQAALDGEVTALEEVARSIRSYAERRAREETLNQSASPIDVEGIANRVELMFRKHVAAGIECVEHGFVAVMVDRAISNANRDANTLSRGRNWNRIEKEGSKEILDWVAGPNETPSKDAINNEELALLRAALNCLNEEEKAIIELVALSGLTYGEAAERLGQNPSTLRSKAERAKKTLRKYLPMLEEGA
jgi:RNA polymerase sigma factor (sigma-70 family)